MATHVYLQIFLASSNCRIAYEKGDLILVQKYANTVWRLVTQGIQNEVNNNQTQTNQNQNHNHNPNTNTEMESPISPRSAPITMSSSIVNEKEKEKENEKNKDPNSTTLLINSMIASSVCSVLYYSGKTHLGLLYTSKWQSFACNQFFHCYSNCLLFRGVFLLRWCRSREKMNRKRAIQVLRLFHRALMLSRTQGTRVIELRIISNILDVVPTPLFRSEMKIRTDSDNRNEKKEKEKEKGMEKVEQESEDEEGKWQEEGGPSLELSEDDLIDSLSPAVLFPRLGSLYQEISSRVRADSKFWLLFPNNVLIQTKDIIQQLRKKFHNKHNSTAEIETRTHINSSSLEPALSPSRLLVSRSRHLDQHP